MKELACAPPSHSTSSQHTDDPRSISGVEMESPHVRVVGDKECCYEIPGIGVIATSWIGRVGREQLFETFAKEIVSPKMEDMKKELHRLASVCFERLKW